MSLRSFIAALGMIVLVTALAIDVAAESPRQMFAQLRVSAATSNVDITRSGHTSTLLPTGRFLLHGGIDSANRVMSRSELVDDMGNSGQQLATGLIPRAGHTATVLTDGRVVFIGGFGDDGKLVSLVEIWDPQTNAIEAFDARTDAARFGHVAELLPSSPVRISGGFDSSERPVSTTEIFDPVLREFFRLSPAEESRWVIPSHGLPGVAATVPAEGAEDFPVDRWVAIRFSKRVDPDTVIASTVTLFGPEGSVNSKIVVMESGLLAFVNPSRDLFPDSYYTLFLAGILDGERQSVPFTAVSFKTAAIGASGSDSSGSGTGSSAGTGTTIPGAVQGRGGLGDSDPSVPRSGQTASQSVDNDSDKSTELEEDEEWIPGPMQFRGYWRSDRQPHPSAKVVKLTSSVGVTALAGQVLKMNGKPLANVRLSIGEQSAATDESGRFLLEGISPGPVTLAIDGATANRRGASYGFFEARLNIVDGETNDLPWTVWMPKLDSTNEVTIPSPTTEEVVLTSSRIPGFRVRIPKGVVIRDRQGKIVTKIGITPLPVDRTPFPIPRMGFSIYYTVQPGGAFLQSVDGTVLKAAQLVYPNYTEALPSTRASFWLYDTEDRGWFVYGKGKVSPDGKSISGSSDVGLYAFTGGGADFNNPEPDEGPKPCDGDCCMPGGAPPGGGGGGGEGWGGGDEPGRPGCTGSGDPVDASTGSFIHSERDLSISDVVPIDLVRTHKHNSIVDGPFGKGTLNPYQMFLFGVTTGDTPYQAVTLVLPNNGFVRFACIVDNTTGLCSNNILNPVPPSFINNSTPGEFLGAVIKFKYSGDPAIKGWYMTLRDGRLYKFWGHGGHLSYFTDRFGNKTTILRQEGGENTPITSIVSPHGRYVNFAYTAPGFPSYVSQATDNIGRSFTYTYNANGLLETATDPLGGVRHYGYDASNRMTTVQDPNNNVIITNTYYGASDPVAVQGKVKAQTMPDGSTYQFSYTTVATGIPEKPYRVTETNVTDRRGNVRKIEFTAHANSINGYISRNTFPVGKPEQQITSFTRDIYNRLVKKVDALGRTTVVNAFTPQGRPTSVTYLSGTPNAVTWTYTYDTTYNLLKAVTNPLGKRWQRTYAGRGLLTSLVDPLGNVTRTTYTSSGQLQAITDPLGHTITATYFGADLIALTDPIGRRFKFEYDGAGRRSKIRDPLGNVVKEELDALNRFKKNIDPLNGTTSFNYDANGNLTAHTDQRNGMTTYAYNTFGLRASQIDALNNAETYLYDLGGKLRQITDRKGQVTGITYDNATRMSQVGFGATTGNPTTYQSTVSYTYDAGNRVTEILDSVGGTITRTYDGLDRLTQEQTTEGTVSYTYDNANRRTTMTVTGQPAVTYFWDDVNRLTQIVQGGDSITFTYDNANRRTKTTLANGVEMTYGYDAANQLTSIIYTKGGNNIGNLNYAYDGVGRRVSVGGSLAAVGLPSAVASSMYNAANELTSWAGTAFTHDLNGNLTTDASKTYTWNARNQLSNISGGVIASFLYDGIGRRKSKTVAGTQTGYVYDRANFVQELGGATPKANLITGGVDELFQRKESSVTRYPITDALGSVIALTDATGTLATQYAFEPYGQPTRTGAPDTNSQTYTGREDDGTGLFYYRARYYSPATATFVARDPIGIGGGSNFYAYVGRSPLNLKDPWGLDNPGMGPYGSWGRSGSSGALGTTTTGINEWPRSPDGTYTNPDGWGKNPGGTPFPGVDRGLLPPKPPAPEPQPPEPFDIPVGICLRGVLTIGILLWPSPLGCGDPPEVCGR